MVDSAVDAARAGDARALAGMISEEYEDGEGRDRRAIAFLLRSLLGRYPSLIVIVGDLEVEPLSAELATAEMTLILAGRDAGLPLPAGLDGDRLRMRLALGRERGDWRVTRADWGPAAGGRHPPPN